jgi:hypothetical protein
MWHRVLHRVCAAQHSHVQPIGNICFTNPAHLKGHTDVYQSIIHVVALGDCLLLSAICCVPYLVQVFCCAATPVAGCTANFCLATWTHQDEQYGMMFLRSYRADAAGQAVLLFAARTGRAQGLWHTATRLQRLPEHTK